MISNSPAVAEVFSRIRDTTPFVKGTTLETTESQTESEGLYSEVPEPG